jgi:PAS domain-containing protein
VTTDPHSLSLNVDTLNLLLDNVADLLSIVGDEGETLYVSPPIVDSLGYDPEERIGESVFGPSGGRRRSPSPV